MERVFKAKSIGGKQRQPRKDSGNHLAEKVLNSRFPSSAKEGNMRKTVLAIFALLFCGTLAIAQQPYGQTAKSGDLSQTTVQGCLSRSDGGYSLTDNSGATYRLSGDTAKLRDHVGHEIEVKGAASEASATASTAGKQEQPSIEVSSFKHISATCTSKSKSDSDKSPMSEKPPVPK